MYLVNNEITVTWVLGPTDAPLTAADYDINIVPSTLGATYTDNGIVNFVAPTATTAGSLQYLFTPLAAGRYRLFLTTGTNLSYTVLDEKDFWAFQEASLSVASTKVIGAVSYPVPIINPPLAMTGVSDYWFEIHAIGRHATDPHKIVIVGKETSGTEVDIGILDRNTGVITVTSNAFTSANARGAFTQCGGINCDPATGVYVVCQDNQGTNNTYPAYWTTDITGDSWTECTYNGWDTRFSGPSGLFFDPLHKLWWWMGNNTYTSSDGKIWYLGTMDYGQILYPGGNNQLAANGGMEYAGKFKPRSNSSWFAGNTERPMSVDNVGQGAAPIVYTDIIAGQIIGSGYPGVIDPGNPPLYAGVVVDDSGDYVVMAAQVGQIIYSDTGVWEDWTVAAANQVGSETNEFINGTVGNSMGVGMFCQVNGVYWAPAGQGGTNMWWRYKTGGLPIGLGWVQDSTGPFLNYTLKSGTLMRDPYSCRLAYAGYTLWYQQRVIYDTGDL